MKSKIINWAFISLLAFLTACGGSDTTENTGTTTNSGNSDDPVPDDPIADVSNDSISLGTGFGTSHESGVASLPDLGDGESLSANGSTTVSVDIVNTASSNEEFVGARTVYFISSCAAIGLAEFGPSEVQASGTATTVYQDKGCGRVTGADDTIVAFIGSVSDDGSFDEDATAKVTLQVQPAQVGAIQYSSADPSTIALNGFGTNDTPSLSSVEFIVVDGAKNPMPGREVRFELDHELGSATLSLDKAVTDKDGKVVVMLKAGNVSGTIKVKAAVDVYDTSGTLTGVMTTMSAPITMATSLADQNSFDIAIDVANPNAWEKNGTEVNLTAYVADHYQNPVLDGTTVYFRATGGMIEPSCVTSGGTCSVKWTSTNPKPVDGYVTIVGYTRGQGDYQDYNANGLFDIGESFTWFGEFYVDANANNTLDREGKYQEDRDVDNDGTDEFGWDPDSYLVNVDSNGLADGGTYGSDSSNFFEEFVDANNNETFDPDLAIASQKYQGVNCSSAAIADGHCAEQIQVYDSVRLQMSQGNSVFLEGPFTYNDAGTAIDYDTALSCVDISRGAQLLVWRLADSQERRNDLPAGSKIDFAVKNVEMLSQNGTGDVAVHFPSQTISVWTALNGLDANAYLNERGMIVSGWASVPDSPKSSVGQVSVEVDMVNAGKAAGGATAVDLVGYTADLREGRFQLLEVNVINGAKTITVEARNNCGHNLPAGAKLVVATNEADMSSPSAVSGGTLDGGSTPQLVEMTSDGSGRVIMQVTVDADATADATAYADLDVYVELPNGDFFKVGVYSVVETDPIQIQRKTNPLNPYKMRLTAHFLYAYS